MNFSVIYFSCIDLPSILAKSNKLIPRVNCTHIHLNESKLRDICMSV